MPQEHSWRDETDFTAMMYLPGEMSASNEQKGSQVNLPGITNHLLSV